MNPLLSSQNLFILNTINPKKPEESKLLVINEFEGFFNYVEDQMAVSVFGKKEDSKKERIQYARDLLIKMIGTDEFMRLKHLFEETQSVNPKKNSYKTLDDTERIIFKLIAKGFSQSEIAELLDWTSRKVEQHKERIYAKMNFSKTADLMEYANRNRLL